MKPHFVKSKLDAFSGRTCDDKKCIVEGGRPLVGSDYFFNTSKRAIVRNICPLCYLRRQIELEEAMEYLDPPAWHGMV